MSTLRVDSPNIAVSYPEHSLLYLSYFFLLSSGLAMCTVDTEFSEHQQMLLKRPPPWACHEESSGGLGASSASAAHWIWLVWREVWESVYINIQTRVTSTRLAKLGWIGREPRQGSQGSYRGGDDKEGQDMEIWKVSRSFLLMPFKANAITEFHASIHSLITDIGWVPGI